MNPGGEPERDDTGLPPVDIEIPEDARELDRDVQAYYREQRALRRQQRRSRLHGFLPKDGIVLPLLACCLILALITGTLLTVFTAASNQGVPAGSSPAARPGSTSTVTTPPRTPARSGQGSAGAASKRAVGPAASGRAGTTSVTARPPAPSAAGSVTPIAALPNTAVRASGRLVRLRSLSRAMLVLVPPKCSCTQAVVALALIASRARATAYLVSATGAAQLVGQVHRHGGAAITVAVDVSHVLGQYRHGLTAVLIGRHHIAGYASHLVARENLGHLLQALTR